MARRKGGDVVIQVGGGGNGGNFLGWHVVHLILTIVTCGLWLPVWGTHFFLWLSCK